MIDIYTWTYSTCTTTGAGQRCSKRGELSVYWSVYVRESRRRAYIRSIFFARANTSRCPTAVPSPHLAYPKPTPSSTAHGSHTPTHTRPHGHAIGRLCALSPFARCPQGRAIYYAGVSPPTPPSPTAIAALAPLCPFIYPVPGRPYRGLKLEVLLASV